MKNHIDKVNLNLEKKMSSKETPNGSVVKGSTGFENISYQ